jgi:hypothetical protein
MGKKGREKESFNIKPIFYSKSFVFIVGRKKIEIEFFLYVYMCVIR